MPDHAVYEIGVAVNDARHLFLHVVGGAIVHHVQQEVFSAGLSNENIGALQHPLGVHETARLSHPNMAYEFQTPDSLSAPNFFAIAR